MNDGWDDSAEAWIASLGERGDWGREHVLDPAMLARLEGRGFARALDVGCGEGRFCRIMKDRGLPSVVGLDQSRPLLEAARKRDPGGAYLRGRAEKLPFAPTRFDLVVSCIGLCDIAGFRAAIAEMARVLAPGGSLLAANLTGMSTAVAGNGWVTGDDGAPRHWPIDRYLEEFPLRSEWSGISVVNWHRPLSAYMSAFLEAGLELAFFDEPWPRGGDPERQARYRRAPWFLVMEWRAPGG